MKRVALTSIFSVLTPVVLLLLAGCNQSAIDPSTVASTTVERGPVTATLSIHPKQARLSDQLEMRLVLEYESGVEIAEVPFGESLNEFEIRSFDESRPRENDGQIVSEQTYLLEPTQAGELIVAPITIKFTDNRAVGDGAEYELQTDPVVVTVTTMVSDAAPSLTDLHPLADPLSAPTSSRWWWWWLPIPLLPLIAWILWRLLRKSPFAVAGVSESAREWALQELRVLEDSGLSQQDSKQFYVVLTSIVRRYIERTTGIRAPEQTTQEFLQEVTRRHDFPTDEKTSLQEFLESADLVKFAAHEPTDADLATSLHRARGFISVQRSQPMEVA